MQLPTRIAPFHFFQHFPFFLLQEGLSPVIKDILLQLQEQNEEMGCSVRDQKTCLQGLRH